MRAKFVAYLSDRTEMRVVLSLGMLSVLCRTSVHKTNADESARATPSNDAGSFLLQLLGLIVRDEGLDEGLNFPVNPGVELMHGEADAVIRKAVLREVVRANLLAAVPCSHHSFAFLGQSLL